jgi:hypothetical protein
MKTSDTRPSRNRSRGPRRGRRGGRANQGGSNNNSGTYSPKSGSRPAKPKTLWEKILAVFGIGAAPKPAPKPAPRSAAAVGAQTRPITAEPLPSSSGSSSGSSSSRPANSAPRQKRVPENVEVTSARLYVGNLSFDASESDLMDLFNGVGQVQYAEVVSNPHTHRSKGFAFVQMQTIEEAKRAVRELHNQDFMGRPLVVSGAKSQREEAANEPANA